MTDYKIKAEPGNLNAKLSEQSQEVVLNQIVRYFHCTKCIQAKPKHISPREYASIEAGFTKTGLQVWCKRHNENIVLFKEMKPKV